MADFALDSALRAARGDIPGVSTINKFGRNPDCDQAASLTAVVLGRDIWDGGIAGADIWVPPTAARIHQLASSSAEDGAGGTTGMLTCRVSGLDADYVLQHQELTLNGTTDVPTLAYTMIHRIKGLTFGSAGRNLGDIEATADDDSTVTAKVSINNNQTLMAIFQIPVNHRGFMPSWNAELHKTGGAATFADVFLMSMEFGAGWRVRDSMALSTDGVGSLQKRFQPYKVFQPKEYVKVVANPSKDAQDVGAGFDLYLVKV